MSFEEEYNRRLCAVLAAKADVAPNTVERVRVEIEASGSEQDSRGIDKELEVAGYCAGRYIAVQFDSMADLIRALDAVPDE